MTQCMENESNAVKLFIYNIDYCQSEIQLHFLDFILITNKIPGHLIVIYHLVETNVQDTCGDDTHTSRTYFISLVIQAINRYFLFASIANQFYGIRWFFFLRFAKQWNEKRNI